MDLPKLPATTSPFLWGAVTGAVALFIVGFTWGGWVSRASAERVAVERAETATVAALTPICVNQFNAGTKAKASLAALKEASSYEQADYVIKGGWATMPGTQAEPNRDVATACAAALVK